MVEGTVDMSMIANEPDAFFATMQTLHNNTSTTTSTMIPNSRIETSARRVLQLKYQLRMFQESFNMTNNDNDDINQGPSPEDLRAAYEMTHQSIVLAQNNDNTLPLDQGHNLRPYATDRTSHPFSLPTRRRKRQSQATSSQNEDE